LIVINETPAGQDPNLDVTKPLDSRL